MKSAITLTLFLMLSFFCRAQTEATERPTISFEILPIRQDSFFLIQRVTDPATKDNPRPRTTETPIFFRSKKEWDDFLKNQRKKAAEDRERGGLILEDAIERESSTLQIEAQMRKLDGFFNQKKQ